MNPPSLLSRQRDLLRHLLRAAAERARGEPEALAFPAELERVETDYTEAVTAAAGRRADEETDARAEWEAARADAEATHAGEREAARAAAGRDRETLKKEYETRKEELAAEHEETCWTIGAVLEGALGGAQNQRRENEARFAHVIDGLQTLRERARALLERWGQPADDFEAEVGKAGVGGAAKRKPNECLTGATDLVERLETLTLPRLLKSGRAFLLLALLCLALVYPLGWLAAGFFGLDEPRAVLLMGFVASALVTLLAGVVAAAALSAVARSQTRKLYQPFYALTLEVNARRQHLLELFEAEQREEVRAARKRSRVEVHKAEAIHRQKLNALKARLAGDLLPIKEELRRRLAENDQRRAAKLKSASQRCQSRLAETRKRHDDESGRAEQRCQSRLRELRAAQAEHWAALFRSWQAATDRLRREAADFGRQARELFPPWEADYRQWQPPSAPPPLIQFGSFRVDLTRVPHGVPEDERLRALTPPAVELPALCDFPAAPSLVLEAGEGGRAEAAAALQAILFRMLTAIPAGKLRCVIVDPVGLGQNFAAFMHLADYDEALIAGRIWTEAAHIEQRLADLTAHMEKVIQKYLRNSFADVAEYNAHAGEVAEPFRVLVVANFPVNFSAEAARRLVSIMQSGPRCGVFTLLSVDTRQPLPEGFDLADLRNRAGARLVFTDGRFTWQDEDFASYPLTLIEPPPDALGQALLEKVGEAARAGRRVEVPFEFIAPAPDDCWTGDSRDGLSVALGRAGATQRQCLELGKGTAQHAVVAGKTGSGKSTLFHALITNLSLVYSPDEVELYLVDFKKGVEFKAYAAQGLPHARVIAVESEREFGLSVLQRLDAELRSRGEHFRAAGAQNLADYRRACPAAPAPRVLLIVDEFQEFFVEDDRLAQDAAQLLDRLVRQGRAFGIHVVLGSQTLGGAYSLARSTIDQMAIRVALQCSEVDAGLILGDDNAAARLLSRPGEAIYNDQNGLVEGNHPFQVVWLDDARREDYLTRVRELSHQRPPRLQAPTVVFEGNAPADVSRNQHLGRLVQECGVRNAECGIKETDPHSALRIPHSEVAWLGDALALNDLTAVTFRRQNGSNLMIVGQQEEMALGMLSVATIGLAAQRGGGAARFFVIDGQQAGPPPLHDGVLARLPDVLSAPVRVVGWRDAAAVIGEVAAEVERRQQAPESAAPPAYPPVVAGSPDPATAADRRSPSSFWRPAVGEVAGSGDPATTRVAVERRQQAPESAAAPAFLVLHGLQRLRDLRRRDDDFGFGTRDEPPGPPQQFATILREGPPLGVHVLLWCDSLNNLQRFLDRASLRELGLRVVFQMGIADSSSLIDSPAASKLGPHRALLYSEEDGRLEKFRPYGVPPDSWLDRVREQLRPAESEQPAPAG